MSEVFVLEDMDKTNEGQSPTEGAKRYLCQW